MSDKEGSPSGSEANEPGSPAAGSNNESPKISVSHSGSHSPSHSKSRSRSPSEEKVTKKKSRSRSRSSSRKRKYSRSPDRNGARKSRSYRSRSRSYDKRRSRDEYDYYESKGRNYGYDRHSPFSHRKRHRGDRENPLESRCLGVFGLSLHTQERDLREIFGHYGPVEDVQVVYDHQTGRSRGFAFVYMRHVEDAVEAKERAPGSEIDGRRIRVDFSITERAHTPTPGVYLGRPADEGYPRRGRGGGGGGGGYGGPGYYRRASPSEHYGGGSRRRYSRSRSRSYSPRYEERTYE